MQYGRALDRLNRETVIADLALGTICILKADVRSSFYHIGLRPKDAHKIGLVFTSDRRGEELVAIPLTIPMLWKNYPPIFCRAIETVAGLTNTALRCN